VLPDVVYDTVDPDSQHDSLQDLLHGGPLLASACPLLDVPSVDVHAAGSRVSDVSDAQHDSQHDGLLPANDRPFLDVPTAEAHAAGALISDIHDVQRDSQHDGPLLASARPFLDVPPMEVHAGGALGSDFNDPQHDSQHSPVLDDVQPSAMQPHYAQPDIGAMFRPPPDTVAMPPRDLQLDIGVMFLPPPDTGAALPGDLQLDIGVMQPHDAQPGVGAMFRPCGRAASRKSRRKKLEATPSSPTASTSSSDPVQEWRKSSPWRSPSPSGRAPSLIERIATQLERMQSLELAAKPLQPHYKHERDDLLFELELAQARRDLAIDKRDFVLCNRLTDEIDQILLRLRPRAATTAPRRPH